jgi:hypothetical protein
MKKRLFLLTPGSPGRMSLASDDARKDCGILGREAILNSCEGEVLMGQKRMSYDDVLPGRMEVERFRLPEIGSIGIVEDWLPDAICAHCRVKQHRCSANRSNGKGCLPNGRSGRKIDR